MNADPRGLGSPQPDTTASVHPMLPMWPEVRCDRPGCRTVYTMPENRRTGLVSGDCPNCHYAVFSTSIVGDIPPVTFDFDQFKQEGA